MLVQVGSDFHIEMFQVEEDCMNFLKPKGDYLALCGDIGSPGKPAQYDRLERLVRTYSQHFKHVFLIAGNHEYYVPGKNHVTMSEIDGLLEKICQNVDNATYLQKKSVLIDGVRVIGATMWSDVVPSRAEEIQRSLNDYRIIYVDGPSGPRRVTVADTVKLHREHLDFIMGEVSEARLRKEKCVILTHHSPLIEGSTLPKYQSSPIISAFCNDLKEYLKHKDFHHVKLWAYGHTHHNNRRKIGKTMVMANQVGYTHEFELGRDYQENHCYKVK